MGEFLVLFFSRRRAMIMNDVLAILILTRPFVCLFVIIVPNGHSA